MNEYIPPPQLESYIDNALFICSRLLKANKYAILSGSRRKPTAQARRVFATLLRQELGMTYPEIAVLLGQDHTGIMWSVAKCEKTQVDMELVESARKLLLSPCDAKLGVEAIRLDRRRRAREHSRPAMMQPIGPPPAPLVIDCPKCGAANTHPLKSLPFGRFCVECNHEWLTPTLREVS